MPTSHSCRRGIPRARPPSPSGSGSKAHPSAWVSPLLAGLVGLSCVATGAHYPGDVFAGFGIGAGIAILGGRVDPTDPHRRACPRPHPCASTRRPDPRAPASSLVINPASGGGTGARVVDEVRDALPETEIIELGEGRGDVVEVLRAAARALRGARGRRW